MAIAHSIIKGLDSLVAKRICEIDKRCRIKRQIDRISIKIEMYFLKVLRKGSKDKET